MMSIKKKIIRERRENSRKKLLEEGKFISEGEVAFAIESRFQSLPDWEGPTELPLHSLSPHQQAITHYIRLDKAVLVV